jgi:hypothetical protein
MTRAGAAAAAGVSYKAASADDDDSAEQQQVFASSQLREALEAVSKSFRAPQFKGLGIAEDGAGAEDGEGAKQMETAPPAEAKGDGEVVEGSKQRRGSDPIAYTASPPESRKASRRSSLAVAVAAVRRASLKETPAQRLSTAATTNNNGNNDSTNNADKRKLKKRKGDVQVSAVAAVAANTTTTAITAKAPIAEEGKSLNALLADRKDVIPAAGLDQIAEGTETDSSNHIIKNISSSTEATKGGNGRPPSGARNRRGSRVVSINKTDSTGTNEEGSVGARSSDTGPGTGTGSVGGTGAGKSRPNTARGRADKVKGAALAALQQGSVLEPCCVYRRESTAQPYGRNHIEYKYSGQRPTAAYRANVSPDQLPFGRLRDHAVQQGLKGLDPTHERFTVTGDAMLSGTHHIVKLNCEYWGSKDKITDYAKVSASSLFI